MYKEFQQTIDNGFKLKKQGVVSTVIIGGSLLILALFLIKMFFETNFADKTLLYLSLMFILFFLIILLKNTRKFIIYPSKKIMTYSSSLISPNKKFAFDDFNGIYLENLRNHSGFNVGSSLKLSFIVNGREKEILLGQNVSAKKIRVINDEINNIINQAGNE